MRNCRNLTVIFIALAAALLVNRFENVTSAPTVSLKSDSESENFGNFRADNRVDFIYSTKSFKEIDYDVLQFIGEDVSKIQFSCESTKNKTAFVGWNYDGIEKRKVGRGKSGEGENGYFVNLTLGPPVVRMECFLQDNMTISNSTLIYTGENQSPYLYNNGKSIQAIVVSRTTALLPCLLKYPVDNEDDGKELQLFKDGNRVDNESYCLSCTPELGYLLNLTQLENHLGTYECQVMNSAAEDVVHAQFDKDAFVSVSYKGYLDHFFAGSPKTQPFECKLPKDIFQNDFKWSYVWKNGTYSTLNEKNMEVVSSNSDDYYYSQRVKVKFDSSDISAIVCGGKAIGSESESPYNNSYPVDIRDALKPHIFKFDPKKPINLKKDSTLTCFATGDDSLQWRWLKNGKPLTSSDPEHQHDKLLESTLSSFAPSALDDIEINYTCIASNFLGSSENNFKVHVGSTNYLFTTTVIFGAAMIWLTIIFIIFKFMPKRPLSPMILKWFTEGGKLDDNYKELQLQPYASLAFDFKMNIKYKDLIFGVSVSTHIIMERKLGSGTFGVVSKMYLRESHSKNIQTLTPVAVKTRKYECTAPEDYNIYQFCQFLAEIKKMQYMGSHQFVVNYIGAVTADVAKYSAYLILEHCSGGDLKTYLNKFNYDGNFLFYDDVQHPGRIIRWTEFIADGMVYLSSKDLLHMDLAARNILLAYPGINSDNIEDDLDPAKLIPKVSDFGLSRYLRDDNNIYQSTENKILDLPQMDPNKAFPLPWLSIESLTRRIFSQKSDVWAYGITLWEMFTLAKKAPYSEERIGPTDRQALIDFLEAGGILQPPDNAPEEIWKIMMECWELHPEARPDFETIRDRLKHVNDVLSEELERFSRRANHVTVELPSTNEGYMTLGILANSSISSSSMDLNEQYNRSVDVNSDIIESEYEESDGENA